MSGARNAPCRYTAGHAGSPGAGDAGTAMGIRYWLNLHGTQVQGDVEAFKPLVNLTLLNLHGTCLLYT